MNSVRRLCVGLSVGALFAGALMSASGVSGASAAAKAKPKAAYKVAVVSDETGAEAPAGLPFADGAAAYFKMVNKKGGVNGHKIDFTVTDAQSTPTVAAAAIEGALSSHDLAIVDGTSSSELPAEQAALGSSPTPLLTYGLADTSLYPTPLSNEYMFAPSARQQATATVNEVKSLLGGSLNGKTIAFVGLNVPYITGMEADIVSDVTPQGATVVQDQLYPFGVTSFTAQASLVANSTPSAVIQAGTAPDTVISVEALIAAGVTKAPIVAYSSGSDTSVFQEIDAPNYYAFRYSAYPSKGTPIYKAVAAEGYASGATDANMSVGWAEAAAVARALEQCTKTCSPNRVNANMSTIPSFIIPDDAYYGPIRVSTTDHAAVTAGQFYTYDVSTNQVVESGKPVNF